MPPSPFPWEIHQHSLLSFFQHHFLPLCLSSSTLSSIHHSLASRTKHRKKPHKPSVPKDSAQPCSQPSTQLSLSNPASAHVYRTLRQRRRPCRMLSCIACGSMRGSREAERDLLDRRGEGCRRREGKILEGLRLSLESWREEGVLRWCWLLGL